MENQKWKSRTIAIVQYADNYLQRKFGDWTDEEVAHERSLTMRDLSLLTAEANRRGIIEKPSGSIHSLDEFHEYIVGKTFIITHEYRYHDGKVVSACRPEVGEVVRLDTEKSKFEIKAYDYDQRTDYECEHSLPRWSSITSTEKGNICFEIVSEFKGRDLVTRFWEK